MISEHIDANTPKSPCMQSDLCSHATASTSELLKEILFQGCPIVFGVPILTTASVIIDNASDGELIANNGSVDRQEELKRFYNALDASRNSLYLLYLKLQDAKDRVAADIVMAQRALIQDPWFQSILLEGILSKEQRVEQAVYQAMIHLRYAFSIGTSGDVSEKYEDIEDLLKRILFFLKEEKREKRDLILQKNLSNSGAVIACSISPSLASELSSCNIKALITCNGGIMSHTAVIMKSLGIPYITGISQSILTAADRTSAILIIPETGTVILNPSEERAHQCFLDHKSSKKRVYKRKSSLINTRVQSQQSAFVDIQATVHNQKEICEARQFQAAGIGLVRTEYLAFSKGYVPSFDEQVEEYKAIFDAAQGMLISFRTFDFSSDKEFFLSQQMDKDFVHGVLLRKPIYLSLLKEQVRALISASQGRDFKILFPMISSSQEAQLCLDVFHEIWNKSVQKGGAFSAKPKVGMMIELPRTGLVHTLFHLGLDFISLGTNDLLQYALAIDRNCTFSKTEDVQFIFAHMGFLHILYHIIQKSIQQNIPLSICGEMASDSLFLPLLLGFGANSISVAPKNIEKIRKLLDEYDSQEIAILTQKVLSAGSTQEITQIFQNLVV